jgi:hypothetical protein
MGAWLERDVQRRAGGVAAMRAAVLERRDLGMSATELGMVTLADHLAAANQDGANHGVGADPPAPQLGQLQRTPQMDAILVGDQLGRHQPS